MQSTLAKKSRKETYINLFVLLIFLAFFLSRLPDIHIPYCSDELDVYAQGILYMYDHTPSLLPGSIPPILSRGHPLMFYFLGGVVFKFFGPTLETAHMFCLIISVIWAISIYVFAKSNFSPQIALCALLIFLAQPMVISQSTMLLPEVLLALFTMLAIFFYLKNRQVLYALFCSLAILTKESGVVLPALILGISLLPQLRKVFKLEYKPANFWLFLPFIVFAAFFVIQKFQNGWFFFPLHTGLVSFSPNLVSYKLFKTCYFFLVAQGKYVLSILFSLSLFFYFKRSRGIKIDNLSKEERIILFLALYIGSVVAFSIINFYNNRYYLLILGPLFTMVAYFFNHLVEGSFKRLIIVTLVTIIPLFFFLENKKKYNLDVDLGYKYMIQNQLDFIKYLEDNNYQNARIFANSPFYETNLDPRFGYVKKPFNFTNKLDSTVEYVAVLYLDVYNYWEPPKDKSVLIKTFTKEYSTISFYKIKK